MCPGKHSEGFATLIDIMARLRGPEGCPWDRKQTPASLKPYLLEECYEVIEALEQGESRKLCEELGDLLMQLVLQAQLAAEAGDFDMGDVLQSINTKMVQRHPHVFGGVKVKDDQEVAVNWENLKIQEQDSLLSGLPKEMPALAYSQAMQRRMARAGFAWEEETGKLGDKVRELENTSDREERVEKWGETLFALADLARRTEVDLEEALRRANGRFRQRFSYIEQECRRRGLSWQHMPDEERKALWREAEKLGDGRGERKGGNQDA